MKSQEIGQSLQKVFRKFAAGVKRGWRKFLRGFTKWIDPKLEPYRPHSRTATGQHFDPTSPDNLRAPNFTTTPPVPTAHAVIDDTPKTRADIFEIINQAPHSVFSQRERHMVTNFLDLPETKTSGIMLPASKIVYVDADEVLGPLTLDRLYRSGLSHFPVKNAAGELIGCVHTTHFNSLDIRESLRVSDILDRGLYFVRDDYSLEQTLDTFLRTNAFLLLATDRYGKIVGMVNFSDLLRYLFGANPKDSFDRDHDRLAVAKRREA